MEELAVSFIHLLSVMYLWFLAMNIVDFFNGWNVFFYFFIATRVSSTSFAHGIW